MGLWAFLLLEEAPCDSLQTLSLVVQLCLWNPVLQDPRCEPAKDQISCCESGVHERRLQSAVQFAHMTCRILSLASFVVIWTTIVGRTSLGIEDCFTPELKMMDQLSRNKFEFWETTDSLLWPNSSRITMAEAREAKGSCALLADPKK